MSYACEADPPDFSLIFQQFWPLLKPPSVESIELRYTTGEAVWAALFSKIFLVSFQHPSLVGNRDELPEYIKVWVSFETMDGREACCQQPVLAWRCRAGVASPQHEFRLSQPARSCSLSAINSNLGHCMMTLIFFMVLLSHNCISSKLLAEALSLMSLLVRFLTAFTSG